MKSSDYWRLITPYVAHSKKSKTLFTRRCCEWYFLCPRPHKKLHMYHRISMIFQPRGIHKNFDADLILPRFTIVSTTLYASTNFFAAETTLQSYASYLFLKQQFNKNHVSCDTFTSTCRMTMIFFYWRTPNISRSTLNIYIMCLKRSLSRSQPFIKVSPW